MAKTNNDVMTYPCDQKPCCHVVLRLWLVGNQKPAHIDSKRPKPGKPMVWPSRPVLPSGLMNPDPVDQSLKRYLQRFAVTLPSHHRKICRNTQGAGVEKLWMYCSRVGLVFRLFCLFPLPLASLTLLFSAGLLWSPLVSASLLWSPIVSSGLI